MAYGIKSEIFTEGAQNKNANVWKDIALAPARGLEGAVQSIYQLGDWATGDRLPDYNQRLLGKSETWQGGLVEGMAQLATVFIPVAGWGGAAAQATRFGSWALKAGKAGKMALNWKGLVAAEATADFLAFRSQEERLSNLIQQFPQLQNPITEYLAADGDDAELEGRLKNSLEGLGIGGIMSVVGAGVVKSLKLAKRGNVEAAKANARGLASVMRSILPEPSWEMTLSKGEQRWWSETWASPADREMLSKDFGVSFDGNNLRFKDPNKLTEYLDEIRMSRSEKLPQMFYEAGGRKLSKRFTETTKEAVPLSFTDPKYDQTKGVLQSMHLYGNEIHGGQVNVRTNKELSDGIGITNIYQNMSADEILKAEDMAHAFGVTSMGARKSMPVRDVLSNLSEKGDDEFVRKMAKGLNDLLADDVEFGDVPVSAALSKDAYGAYEPFPAGRETSQINIYTNLSHVASGRMNLADPFRESTILHEIVHASAVRRIDPALTMVGQELDIVGESYLQHVDDWLASAKKSNPSYKIAKAYRAALDAMPPQFEELFDHLNDPHGFQKAAPDVARGSTGQWYGFTNIDEFISESMTNKEFQDFLKSVPSEKGKSVWDSVLSWLKEIFGADSKGTLMEDFLDGYTTLVKKQKRQFQFEDYVDLGHVDNVHASLSPSRNARYLAKEVHAAEVEVKAGLEELKFSERTGGKLAIEGAHNVLRKTSTSTDVDVLLQETETAMLANMKTSPKLTAENLEVAGIMQAVDNLSEAAGVRSDLWRTEVVAAGEDAEALRRIAARLWTVESLATAQADNVWEAAQAISKAGTATTDVQRATFVGELKKMVELTRAGTDIRRGFGQGLRSTQLKRTKLSLDEFEVRSKDIVGEYLANNTGKKMNELVNAVLNSHDPQDAIASMLGIAKSARAATPKGWMEAAQTWFVNSLLSGPRTMVKNGIGNVVANTLLNVELAVGGAAVNPAITKQVLKEFTTLDSYRESMQYALKAWKNKEQLLDIGRSPLENTRKTKIDLSFDSAGPEDTMKKAIEWMGNNVVNTPTRVLMSMDEVFKQTMFRQRAKLELTMKAMDMGISNPDDVAEYVSRGMDALLVDGERAFTKDSIIKFAHSKAAEADKARIEAGLDPMKPSERGELIQQTIEEETAKRTAMIADFDKGGLGIKDLSELDMLSANALEDARYATFTNDAGKATEIAAGLVQNIPLLKFVFPFIRTPVNLIKFSLDRASFAAPEMSRTILSKMPDLPFLRDTQIKLRKELASRDPIKRAQAIGKMATSAMINATLLTTIMANRDFITGGGPKDINQKKTLEQAGWQPYSFKLGDKYVSYQGLDPFGTHFGVLVDLVDQMDDSTSLNTGVVEHIFTAAAISMTRNITERSYLAGLQFLTDALSEPDRKLSHAMRNLAGGFVPNILYQGQSLTGDTTVREVRGIADALLKKLPSGGDLLDPKRNLLGESIIREQVPLIGPFNPAAISTREGDPVFEELAKLEHGFSNPSHVLDRLIDLTEFYNDRGQTAHDRRLELMGQVKLGGRTMRESLTSIIKSKNYQNLSPFTAGGFKSPRVDILNRVMGKYRTAALAQMMQEFPEIQRQYAQINAAKYQATQGASEDVLSSLLTF